jgi:hypothetical protein
MWLIRREIETLRVRDFSRCIAGCCAYYYDRYIKKKASKSKFSFLLIVTLKASLKLIPNFRIIQFKASILSDMIEAKEKIPRFYNQRWVVP